ncbi:MAG: non-canonical purine NTP pyrophosphatase [Verrucomicrobia bacterium]|nr:non-canonical purine NTP pyrophosphatase [Verrucomicrobiota bacterium]
MAQVAAQGQAHRRRFGRDRRPRTGLNGAVTTLFIATGNAHKVEEIRAVLAAPGRVFLWQPDAQVRLEPEETGATFAENARIKALTWATYLAMEVCNLGVGWVLADDSGLEVDALGGAPGVHSARFAALDTGRRGNSPDAENNGKLLRLLAGVPPERRSARFRCALALTPVLAGRSAGEMAAATLDFDGVCEGRLLDRPGVSGGFGYDPLFVPVGWDRPFSVLGAEVKNRISHRARALEALRAGWEEGGGPAGVAGRPC